MTLEALRALHDSCNPACITDRIRKHDCVLDVTQNLRPDIIAVDCDVCGSFSPTERRPDFILLLAGDTPRWFVVEMKSRIRSIGELLEQLQAGGDSIQAKSEFDIPASPRLLTFLVLHERGPVKTADFQSRTLRIFGKRFPILHKRCGISLETLI